jgi:glycine cleavage system H protein
MNFPEQLKYTNDHEWISVSDKIGIIGITDYAQKQLGDIIYLDITANIGDEILKGDSVGTIEAVKTVSEIFSPVSGKITDLNIIINDNPSNVNHDPYGSGWIAKVELSDPAELDELMDSNTYKDFTGE